MVPREARTPWLLLVSHPDHRRRERRQVAFLWRARWITSGLPVNLPGALAILALMQPDQQVVSAWRASAPFWEKHREIIQQMFAPVTQALVEDGLISGGHTVLDVATGPGEPALTLAALVGAEGKVLGLDPAPEMVEAARRATDHLG